MHRKSMEPWQNVRIFRIHQQRLLQNASLKNTRHPAFRPENGGLLPWLPSG